MPRSITTLYHAEHFSIQTYLLVNLQHLLITSRNTLIVSHVVLINCVQNITNMKKSSIKGKYSTVHTLGTLVEYFLKHGHHTLSTFTSVPLQCCKLASQEVIKCLIENNNSSSSIKQVHPYTQTGFAILQNNLFIIFSSNKRIEIVNQY